MRYVTVPREISSHDVRANDFNFSPGRYVRFEPSAQTTTSHFAPLDKLVLLRSAKVKATKKELYHYAEIGDVDVATGGISWQSMQGFWLPTDRPQVAQTGDILISTVRTYRKGIGYVASTEPNLVTTGAFLNICGLTDYEPGLTPLYLYSFLRSDLFTEQIWAMLNRGVYPRMDAGALDKILIPIISDARVVQYVSALMQAVVDKERTIRARHMEILDYFEGELGQQNGVAFSYRGPTSHEVRRALRLDAGLYCEAFQAFKHRVVNYRHGATTLEAMGVGSRRGPNLAVSVIGKSLYSETEKPSWYELIRPVSITEYGTLSGREWLGSRRKLPLVNQGEIIFGCEATWRSLVLCDPMARCTTNFHGTVLHWQGAPLHALIWLRCYLEFLRDRGLLRYIAVGGQGGHLSPEYFDYIPIPKFPDEIQAQIARLYHNSDAVPPTDALTLDGFVAWHRAWNDTLGIWELDREMKRLQATLRSVQDEIIQGKTVVVPLA